MGYEYGVLILYWAEKIWESCKSKNILDEVKTIMLWVYAGFNMRVGSALFYNPSFPTYFYMC